MNWIFFIFSLIPFAIFGMDQATKNVHLVDAKQLLFVKGFLNEKFQTSYELTTLLERRSLGFHGIKIPIFLYTLGEDKQTDEIAGYIVKGARPTTWLGALYDEKAMPIDRVFLKIPVMQDFKAQILGRDYYAIRSSCLLVKKDTTKSILALLWSDYLNNKKLFLTLCDLGALEYDDPIINLDENKQQAA